MKKIITISIASMLSLNASLYLSDMEKPNGINKNANGINKNVYKKDQRKNEKQYKEVKHSNNVLTKPKPIEQVISKPIVENKIVEKHTKLYTDNKPIKNKIEESKGFNQKPVFQGNIEKQQPDLLRNYIKGNIKDRDITMLKRKKNKLAEVTNTVLDNIILNNRTIYYNIDKSLSEIINLRMNYSTDIEFVDDLGNSIPIRGMSLGNKPFTLENPEPNLLSVFPTEKYKETNFTIRMEGYNNPIIFRMMEGRTNIVDTRVKVVLTSNIKSNSQNDVSFKSNILKELLKTGTLRGHVEKDYEVFDIAKRETSYFNKQLMKVYKVNKMGKEYNIILLDSNYEILGEHYSNFNRYQNTLNAYFLKSNRQVFTIMSKVDKIKNNLSFDFIKDLGLVEKYRISIID